MSTAGLHRPSGRHGLGLLLTLTTVALWSSLPLGLEVALEYLDPITLVWSRFLVATVVLAVALRLRATLPSISRIDTQGWRLLAIATVFLGLNYVCYLFGLRLTNAATAQVIIQLAPLLLALGGIVVFRERFAPAQWLGLAAIFVGLVVFSRDQLAQLGGDGARYGFGVVLMVAAGITWAAYGLAQKQLLNALSSSAVMLLIYTGCALAFLPLSTPSAFGALDARGWFAFAFCAFNTLAAYGCFAEALAHWEASRVSAVLASVPLVTLLLLYLAERFVPGVIEPEPISTMSLAGAALVVGGSVTAVLVCHRPRRVPEHTAAAHSGKTSTSSRP